MNNDITSFIKVIDVIEQDNSFVSAAKETIYFAVKRLFDIIISLIGLLFILPVMFIIKIAYILTGDFKPILYTQNRIGYLGKEFKFYKFRSMVPNADEELKKLLKIKKYNDEWNKNQKLDNDPRITKIGKFIRKTSIDELPQFINVLKGDMSLIGPRPLVKNELESHNGIPQLYENTKPGITGWWACNGRSSTDYNERLKLEYYYVSNQCISLDIKCILKTISAIVSKTGAK